MLLVRKLLHVFFTRNSEFPFTVEDLDFLLAGTIFRISGLKSGPVFVSYSIKVCNEGAQNSSNDLNIDAAFACIGVDFKFSKGDIRVPSPYNVFEVVNIIKKGQG